MRFLACLLGLACCACSTSVEAAVRAPAPAPGTWRLWQDQAVFSAVDRLLAGARGRVWVEMYEFGRPDLAASLLAARRRGADVRLVYDPTVGVSRATAARLRGKGLPVRPYPVDDRLHQIDHVKLLIADGVALAGGMNWGVTSRLNHDYAVEVRAARPVARLGAIFLQDWRLAGGSPAPLPEPPGDAAEVAQTAPGEGIRALLEGDLARARRRIRAEVFALTDPEVIAALAIAARGGLDVRVLLDPNQDVNRPTYQLLRAGGVPVRWYPAAAGTKLHAKAGLFDRRLVVGSANWSRSGLGSNHELDLEVTAPADVEEFSRRFDLDWAAAG
ncbi:MAG: phospholipase D-like domain-containing protein [Candidatus Dormibacteraceae bacterium]